MIKSIKSFDDYIVMFMLTMLVPFAYYTVFDIRIVVLALVGFVSLFVRNISKVSKDIFKIKNLWCAFSLILYCIFFSTSDIRFLTSLCFFCLFTYWPLLFPEKDKAFLRKIQLLYSAGVLFISSGLLIQILLCSFFNFEIGMHAIMGGPRVAHGFIWQDFSFLSLYLAGSIPIFFESFNKKIAFVLSGFTFFASCLTSARTGPYSFFIFLILLLVFKICSKSKRVKYSFFEILTAFLYYFFVFKIAGLVTRRGVDLDDSGRTEIVNQFIESVDSNLFGLVFGNGFSGEDYFFNIGVVPHHFLIHLLPLGGILFTIIFLLWLFRFFWDFRYYPKYLVCLICINFIGFNFIPSFFSAYFFGFILSIHIYENQLLQYQIKSYEKNK